MLFSFLLFIVAVPLSYLLAIFLWELQHHYKRGRKKTAYVNIRNIFIRNYTATLFTAFVFCIPMLHSWHKNNQIEKQLLNQPFATVIRKYHSDIYQELLAKFRRTNNKRLTDLYVNDAIRKLYVRWIRATPNASIDAIMLYVRYRYSESIILGNDNDELCRYITQPDPEILLDKHIEIMRKNAPYIEEIMINVFTSSKNQVRLTYPERRTASRNNNMIMDRLNTELAVPAAPFVGMYGCEFQKMYYLELLEYSDNEIAKIMRWTIKREIESYDKQQKQP